MKSLCAFLSNNHGYALVIVLLTITIFLLLGFTFMGHALNTTKQSSIIEDRIQATDLAEMGAEYYSRVIDEEIDEIYKILDAKVNNELIPNITQDEWETKTIAQLEKDLTDKAKSLAKNLINDHNFTLNKKTMEHENELVFDLKKFDYDGEQKIEYEVIGETEESNATIRTFLKLEISNIQVILGEKISRTYTEPPDTFFTDICASNLLDFTEKKCKIQSRTFENGNGSSPIFSRSQIKVNGNLILPNINNNDLSDSKIYIGGNLGTSDNKYQANLNGTNNYYLYIAGDAYIQNTNNATNAKICANRLMAYQGGDATVYAKAIGNENDVKGSVNLNPVDFENNCKWEITSKSGSSGLIWDDPIGSREFHY